MRSIVGPFGATSVHLESVPVATVAAMYRAKCGFDAMPHFHGISALDLFECSATGYRFWRPTEAAGDESFYRGLSAAWPEYYREWRWEYGPMLARLKATDSLLEIGCGRGFFLKHAEKRVVKAMGLEFNREAIASKVTGAEIRAQTVEACADGSERFDVICSSQVLEHVTDPASFMEASIRCARRGGVVMLSTPDQSNRVFANREDAFDLPPHHMGQFRKDVYLRLAKRYGLRIRAILQEPRWKAVRNPSEVGSRSILKESLSLVHRWVYGPGRTILAVYQKP